MTSKRERPADEECSKCGGTVIAGVLVCVCDGPHPNPTAQSLTPKGEKQEQQVIPAGGYVPGHASDCAKQDDTQAACTCEARENGKDSPSAAETGIKVQDACRSFAQFCLYHDVALAVADTPFLTVSIEYPLYLVIKTPNGETVTAAEDRDGDWTISTPEASLHDHEQVEMADAETPQEIAYRLVEEIDAFTYRGKYATAAERRQADRDEAAARNRR